MISIGLIADTDLPAEIADELAGQLPDVLRERLGGETEWEVSVRREPLPVHARPKGLIETVHELVDRERWDLGICLTDIPLQADGRPVVAEASPKMRVGLVSLPALGPLHPRTRTREAVVIVVRELLARCEGPPVASEARPRGLPHLQRERSAVGVRFMTPPARGTLLLLAGMVRANRPWKLVLGLLSALTAAVATAALANLNNTVWRVAGALGTIRLAALTVVSLATMIGWLILLHRLWRQPSAHMTRRQAELFNLTTTFTLLIGVGTLYVGLFVFNVLTGALVIDPHPLGEALGHPVGVTDYLRLAWFVSSVATVGGALGSGLESNRAVRAAAYRYQPEKSDD